MPLTKSEICSLLPHTGEMCLLDAVERWNDDEIVCRVTSHRDPANPLRREGVLAAIAGVEYAAQAIGAHGRLASSNQSKPAAGFLASLRDVALAVDRLDDVADTLTVHVQRLADSGESVMCRFSIRAHDRELVSGRATLLLEAA
jgi:predicted hotdog family 3-hydroxylacyl-ACP dehydratase